jgi:predicted PhzF superfamily epimerase YddE/YHI9
MVAYWTILAVAVLGTVNGPWYFLLLGAAVLTYTAVRDQRQFQPRFAALGMTGLLEAAAYGSAARALLAAIAAYGLGAVARLVFS